MFSLGFVSAILGDRTLEEVFQFASVHGFSCIEVMCWPSTNQDTRRYAGVCHIDVENLDVELIKSLQVRYNVFVSGLGYYPNPLDANNAQSSFYVDHIKKVITACNKLNIPVMNTFIGRDHTKSIEYNLDKYKAIWPSIVKHAESLQVKIGIENCPMFFTQDEWPGGKNLATSPIIWDKMFEIIPSPTLGLNYDPSHMVWQMMDEIAPVYNYPDRLHHIHLKDVKVYKDRLDRVGIMAYPLQYHSPKLPGLGDVRWSDFFSALTTVGYRGPLCIEVEDKAFEKTPGDVEKAILVAKGYVGKWV